MRYLYIGTEPREFPGDGTTPSFSVDVGDQVEADDNHNRRWFDPETTGDPAQAKE